jgi:hypothetical protein
MDAMVGLALPRSTVIKVLAFAPHGPLSTSIAALAFAAGHPPLRNSDYPASTTAGTAATPQNQIASLYPLTSPAKQRLRRYSVAPSHDTHRVYPRNLRNNCPKIG